MKKTLIIAVSAVSGGGKTTVIEALNKGLTSSKALYFDDYDVEECPDDFFEWIQRGANYNEWNTDILVKDINYLLTEANLDYVLLDYPFAYKNDKVASYIDYTIFIDTPLDIAMARRILRDNLDESVDLIKNDLTYYLSKGRVAYLEMIKTIKPNSDFIIDGTLKLDHIVAEIIKKIKVIKLI